MNKWLQQIKLTEDDILRFAREILEQTTEPGLDGVKLLNKSREIFAKGIKAHRDSLKSVTFEKAFQVSYEERSHRKARTKYEIKGICRRFMKSDHELENLLLRDISIEKCLETLKSNAVSDLQFVKMRSILHSVFACGVRHGWCDSNPVDAIMRPNIRETEINPLPWNDIKKLLRTAKKEKFKHCAAAVGIMLWAGIRPMELQRLHWEDIDWEENVINLQPHHTKTGGCRHVTLLPVLAAWLKEFAQDTGKICPPNWVNHWRELRKAVGLIPWKQDILRHTFASYHLKMWHDLSRLQEEMGHRSVRLLKTRYLSMKGLKKENVERFWTPDAL